MVGSGIVEALRSLILLVFFLHDRQIVAEELSDEVDRTIDLILDNFDTQCILLLSLLPELLFLAPLGLSVKHVSLAARVQVLMRELEQLPVAEDVILCHLEHLRSLVLGQHAIDLLALFLDQKALHVVEHAIGHRLNAFHH